MITIRRYRDSVQAACAAEALRNAGIPAEIVGEHSFHVLPVHAYGFASLHLVIPSEAQRERATEILDALAHDSQPLDALPAPDFTRLAPEHRAPPCPACAAPVPMHPAAHRCPACAAPIDPEALIADTYGPEALATCYDDVAAASRCPSCEAPLASDALRGRCVSCGALYDRSTASPEGSQ